MESGTLEICRFLPPALLKIDPGDMDMEVFLRTLAQARYVQELEEIIVAKAIVRVFGE